MARLQNYSVIIPTHNGAFWLDELLSMLARQTWPPEEILVIDSGSEDETREIARRYPTKIVTIQKEEFDHGGTRSMAARMARGDLLVFLTQDAVPADQTSLERLVNAFADKRVGAAYGRQLPAENALPLAAHLRFFNYPASSQLRCWQDRRQYGFRTIFISNSFAAYRRCVLEKIDYFEPHQLFGEDTLALAKILQNGYCVAYVADACVVHSHNYTFAGDLKRYFDIGAFHALHPELLEQFGGAGGAGRDYVLSEVRFLLKQRHSLLIPLSLLRNAGKFMAYHLGRHHRALPDWLVPRCSMHPNWWKG